MLERIEYFWTIDPKTNQIWGLSWVVDYPLGHGASRLVERIYLIVPGITTFTPRDFKAWWPPRPLVITYREIEETPEGLRRFIALEVKSGLEEDDRRGAKLPDPPLSQPPVTRELELSRV